VAERRFIIEPRGVAPAWLKLLVPIASVAAALLLGAIFLWLTGSNPWTVYTEMLDTAFGSSRGFSETLVSATPLILTGVAAAIAFKMLVWNIGGEGQLLMGAIFAAGVAIAIGPDMPAVVALPLVILAGAAGAACGMANSPVTLETAKSELPLVGMTNLLPASVGPDGVATLEDGSKIPTTSRPPAEERVWIGIRPEHLKVDIGRGEGLSIGEGIVREHVSDGVLTTLTIAFGEAALRTHLVSGRGMARELGVGDRVSLSLRPEDVHVLSR